MPQQASGKYLREMSWEEKARVNPLYAIMSVPEFVMSSEEPTETELSQFFAEGRVKANCWIIPWLRQAEDYQSLRVLEYGCGMGRLLRAISDCHVKCSGVDISATMIEKARQYLPESVDVNCLDADGRIPYDNNRFDRVFSYAVFQHIKQASMVKTAVREIARVLKPSALFKLQFEMLYPPFPTTIAERGDSIALENRTILHGWVRKGGIAIWRSKLIRHNNWGGARFGYKQLFRLFRDCGLQVTAVEAIPRAQLRAGLVWFYGMKKG